MKIGFVYFILFFLFNEGAFAGAPYHCWTGRFEVQQDGSYLKVAKEDFDATFKDCDHVEWEQHDSKVVGLDVDWECGSKVLKISLLNKAQSVVGTVETNKTAVIGSYLTIEGSFSNGEPEFYDEIVCVPQK